MAMGRIENEREKSRAHFGRPPREDGFEREKEQEETRKVLHRYKKKINSLNLTCAFV